jgi:hypothetical protein
MVAAGTGNDFKFFPPDHRIVAIEGSDARRTSTSTS